MLIDTCIRDWMFTFLQHVHIFFSSLKSFQNWSSVSFNAFYMFYRCYIFIHTISEIKIVYY